MSGGQAFRAGFWTVLGFGGSQVLRFGFNLITTRLLYPELFGVMGLAMTLVTGLTLCADPGLGVSLIRDQQGASARFRHTVWTLQVLRGLALWLVSAAVAQPLAWFYGDARLAWLIPLAGAAIPLTGLQSTWLLVAVRELSLRRVVLLDLASQLAAGIVMVVWAWQRPGVGALAAGAITTAAVKLLGSHLLADGADRFGWDRQAVARVGALAPGIWASTTLYFLAGQTDRLLLGRLVSFELLGVYGIASVLSELTRVLAAALGGNVLYPLYAQAGEERERLRAAMHRRRPVCLLGMAVLIAGLVTVGDLFVKLIYDARYHQAAAMLPLLALGIWPAALALTADGALLAIGKPRYAAVGHGLKLLFTVLAVPAGYQWAGWSGAVLAVALNDVPSYLILQGGLHREGLSTRADDARATAALLLLMGAGAAVRWLCGAGLPFAARMIR